MRNHAPYFFVLLFLILPAPTNAKNFPPLKFPEINKQQAELGRLLFYDPVLSTSYRISCGSCHNHARGSSNGFLLKGVERNYDQRQQSQYAELKKTFPHAPPLFNVGAKQFKTLFSDGRLHLQNKKIISKNKLPPEINSLLQAQAFLALTSRTELAINSKKPNSEILKEVEQKIQALPNYLPHFQKAFPHIKSKDEITVLEITKAIAAFVAYEWQSENSTFDKYLAGKTTLTKNQKKGMELFYGKAKCSQCHKGRIQTDHKLHGGIRTPSLRNIVATAPYGKQGNFTSLENFINHHAKLTATQRLYIIEFLSTLTDKNSLEGKLKKPLDVPSHLIIE